ncbi:hypothetical protein B0T10DRAFT_565725 [Thelonectria olida]|uniref:Nudix hydrolase domain-containing protein n=1 Tax=Thelonectria olida TaxID=1576542 RepID=A0A9P8VWZ2_9HYPO|nr:hypothetical protein B0T10DRAFT_565725 [Thelonectria olida]
MPPPLKRRAVAGSFIFKFPDDDLTKTPKVALFRRSGKVRTYQHKYAAVSGSVEASDASPLATAWRELQEETTLTATSLRLFRQGKPYSFVDESIGREWTINPFGFVLKSQNEGGRGEAGIQIDWEHEGYDWFDPREVNESDEFGGVPRILESLRRVWFEIDLGEEAGRILSQGLTTLQQDHESGAHQLAAKALGIFVDTIKKLDMESPELWWKNARFAAWHLWKNGRESMGASILSVALSSLAIIEKALPLSDKRSLRESMDDIVEALEQYARQRESASTQVGAHVVSFLNTHYSEAKTLRVLTLSSSSTIRRSITQALQSVRPALDIRVLESRPLFEGANMAGEMATFAHSNGIKATVTVFTDASVGAAAQDVDVVLLGADVIDKQGNVSNKTGSLPAALVAKYVSPGVKVLVVSQREKVLPFDDDDGPPGEEDDAQEIVQSWGQLRGTGSAVDVKNVYLEWVSSDLIDFYVTEVGALRTEEMRKWAGEVDGRADRFFTGL